MPRSEIPQEASEGQLPQQTDSVSTPPEFTLALPVVARLLVLVKENQLATAAILFVAWQMGIFLEAWIAIQGVCPTP